MNRMMIYLF